MKPKVFSTTLFLHTCDTHNVFNKFSKMRVETESDAMLSKQNKLLQRQDKTLRETNNIAIRTLEGIELPVFVKKMLSYCPKHRQGQVERD